MIVTIMQQTILFKAPGRPSTSPLIILSALDVSTRLTTNHFRAFTKMLSSAITPSSVCTAACVAAGAVTTGAALSGHDITACIAATLGAVGIFFVSPALDARKTKKGGAE